MMSNSLDDTATHLYTSIFSQEEARSSSRKRFNQRAIGACNVQQRVNWDARGRFPCATGAWRAIYTLRGLAVLCLLLFCSLLVGGDNEGGGRSECRLGAAATPPD
jgi:hypothetical protein